MAKKPEPATTAKLLHTLFQSNERSSGRFDVARERMHTEYFGLTINDFEMHLSGTIGIGGVPILDDDNCLWAAIDIDNHDSDEDIPIRPIDEKIRALKLPLLACRSKSGGVHAYVFLDSPQPATRVRTMMAGWAAQLGYAGCEIFPKQARLFKDKEGKRQLGNWINLPYLGGADTMRYCVREDKRLTAEEFAALAMKMRVGGAELRALVMADHPEAPPCIQKMYGQGVPAGSRNEALYNIVVYLRKMDPDGFDARAQDANKSVFSKPLPKAEMTRTIASASKPDYSYRCGEEPLRSLCDRETCLKRKFGITPSDADRLDTVEALPKFSNLVKYISEPIRWEIQIDDVRVSNLSTAQLLDWRIMREVIAERLTKIVPMIKSQEWERMLAPAMAEVRIVEVPDDASVSGVIRDRLREFASKTDLTNRGEDIDERKALLRGMPVVQKVNGDRCVVFRGQDFINYLKRTRSEELKGINLWFAVKGIGADTTKMRAGDHNINVWTIPVSSVLIPQAEPVKFKSEM